MLTPFYPTNPADEAFLFNPNVIDLSQRPCISVKRESHPKFILAFEKSYYKVSENIELMLLSTKSFFVILDTGSGSSFTMLNKNTISNAHKIRKLYNGPNIPNESEKYVP